MSELIRLVFISKQDFATSSLKGEVALENVNQRMDEAGELEEYQIHDRKQWEHKYNYSRYSRKSIIIIMFYL